MLISLICFVLQLTRLLVSLRCKSKCCLVIELRLCALCTSCVIVESPGMKELLISGMCRVA